MFSIRFALCICISMLPSFWFAFNVYVEQTTINLKKQNFNLNIHKKKTKKYVVYFK